MEDAHGLTLTQFYYEDEYKDILKEVFKRMLASLFRVIRVRKKVGVSHFSSRYILL